MWQNETNRHFETRDLDGDAKRLQGQAYNIVSRSDAKRQRRQRFVLALVLIAVTALLAWMLGAFHPSFGLSA